MYWQVPTNSILTTVFTAIAALEGNNEGVELLIIDGAFDIMELGVCKSLVLGRVEAYVWADVLLIDGEFDKMKLGVGELLMLGRVVAFD